MAGVDRLQINLGLARPGDAFEQEGLKRAAAQRRLDLLVGQKLMRIEGPGRRFGREHAGRRLGLERDQLPARQRPRSLARAFHRSFQLLQIVRARMQFQKGVQLALALGELDVVRCRCQPRRAQPGGRGPQRIALGFQIFHLRRSLSSPATESRSLHWAVSFADTTPRAAAPSSSRRTWTAADLLQLAPKSNCRAVSRPASVSEYSLVLRTSPLSGVMLRSTSPSGAQ